MSNTVHVYPVNDLIEHDTDGGECPCGPETEAVPCDDGTYGWVITHHSMDGREFHEADYAGPAMPQEG